MHYKNKNGGTGATWCKIQINSGELAGQVRYIKYSDLTETKATTEEFEDEKEKQEEEKKNKEKEEEKAIDEYEENAGVKPGETYSSDIINFGLNGVIVGNLPSTPVIDPTDETQVDSYNPNTETNLTEANSSRLLKIGQTVVGIINILGTIIAILVLTILGIKYMVSGIEDKAEYKETMMPYIIGAIFIFSSTTIANLIYNFAITFNN